MGAAGSNWRTSRPFLYSRGFAAGGWHRCGGWDGDQGSDTATALAHRHRRRCARGDPGARSGERLERARLAAGRGRRRRAYGAHDAGGFRDVLPAGEAGTDNVTQLAQFEATGAYPPHWTDQQPLYDNLIQGAEGLTNATIPDFFKDATFGVKPGDVESTTTPKPGVTIIRDQQYGIPHIYGTTRADAMFGTGYAGPRTACS